MDDSQVFVMKKAMQGYGGGFVQAFADLLDHADPMNTDTLLRAFPGLVELYGPGSEFYKAVES